MCDVKYFTHELHSSKGSFTPSDYVAVTLTLTRGNFDPFIKMKGTARQRYGDRYIITRRE